MQIRPASIDLKTKSLRERSELLSQAETSYLKTQRLARIATASSKGIPEVSPVAFEFDGKYLWVGSNEQDFFPTTRRYKNIVSGNTQVSIVIDDIDLANSHKPRGIKFSGTAEVLEHNGIFGKGRYIRITPRVSTSWGIDSPQEGHWSSTKRWR